MVIIGNFPLRTSEKVMNILLLALISSFREDKIFLQDEWVYRTVLPAGDFPDRDHLPGSHSGLPEIHGSGTVD